MAGAVILVLGIVGLGVWGSGKPQPHWRATTAKVVAIAPSMHRFHPNEHYVVVRNAHGTGQFTIVYPLNCEVGESVPVEQAGVSLRASYETCR